MDIWNSGVLILRKISVPTSNSNSRTVSVSRQQLGGLKMSLSRSFLAKRSRRSGKAVASEPCLVERLEDRQLLSAQTVTLGADHDTTIYDISTGDTANGAGEYLVVGGSGGLSSARRGLIHFDVASAGIPEGATILDAVLTLNLAQSVGASTVVSVHLAQKSWGESSSNAAGNEFDGAQAQAFDATWLFSSYDSTGWASAGGDFGGASASTSVLSTGAYEWTGDGLVGDIQNWLDNPSTNFGWLLKSSELAGVIKGFVSRDSTNASLRPKLEITYEDPVVPTIVEGRKWHDRNADGIRQGGELNALKLQFQNGNNFYNSFGGKEYWYRSASNNSWYFLNQAGEVRQWSGQGGKLTGSLVTNLGSRAWHNPSSVLTIDGPADEDWMNGFTFELVDSNGTVVASTVSKDIDLNGDNIIQEESERGWYRFENVAQGTYFVREVVPTGWAQSAGRTSSQAKSVWQLDQTLGLTTTGNLFENYGKQGEKWLHGQAGWYYITPVGDLYRWDGKTVTATAPLNGTIVASPGMPYFRDVSLLHAAENPEFTVASGSVISRLDFGNYRPVIVEGQVLTDLDPNGQQNFGTPVAVVEVAPPTDVPASLTRNIWYEAQIGAARNAKLYATSTGQVFEWSAAAGSVLLTTISGISGLSKSAIQHYAFVQEFWKNDVRVELLDAAGNVIASTLTTNLDRNGNSQVDSETESGWYQFTNLLPGKYTIRQIVETGSVSTSSGPLEKQAVAETLASTHGFRAGATDSFNFGGRNERWFLSNTNRWHYMTPDGKIFEWDRNSGGTRGLVRGREIAQLSGSYYVNLNLLFKPASTRINAVSGQVSSLNLSQAKLIDTVFSSIASQIT